MLQNSLRGRVQASKNCFKAHTASPAHLIRITRQRISAARDLALRALLPDASRRATIVLAAASVSSLSAVCLAGSVSEMEQSSSPFTHDLLVVGPGVLGGYLGKLWKEAFPTSAVAGLTNTENSHDRLKALGFTPYTRSSVPNRKFPYVVYSAPPSGSQDYAGDVKAALDKWDGTGSFVFTSSMSVCAVDNGSTVSEECPLVPLGAGPSTDRLLRAEQAVLQAGGNVLRLVGLYHRDRGAHTYFLKVKEVPRWGGYVVNLLHYEDAARITSSILKGDGTGPFKGHVFLGCDNNPVTFKDMMDACTSSGVFQGSVTFTQPEGTSKGKQADNSATRQALGGWTPKYSSFKAFMEAGGKDFYNTSGLF